MTEAPMSPAFKYGGAGRGRAREEDARPPDRFSSPAPPCRVPRRRGAGAAEARNRGGGGPGRRRRATAAAGGRGGGGPGRRGAGAGGGAQPRGVREGGEPPRPTGRAARKKKK